MKVPWFIGEARSPALLTKDRSFVCKPETAFVRIRRYVKLCMLKYTHCACSVFKINTAWAPQFMSFSTQFITFFQHTRKHYCSWIQNTVRLTLYYALKDIILHERESPAILLAPVQGTLLILHSSATLLSPSLQCHFWTLPDSCGTWH